MMPPLMGVGVPRGAGGPAGAGLKPASSAVASPNPGLPAETAALSPTSTGTGGAFGATSFGPAKIVSAGPTSGGVGSGGTFGSFNGLGHSSTGISGAPSTIAAGSTESHYGFGINPVTGRPWAPGDQGFTDKFGIFDPATGRYINHTTGTSYDPATGFSHSIRSDRAHPDQYRHGDSYIAGDKSNTTNSSPRVSARSSYYEPIANASATTAGFTPGVVATGATAAGITAGIVASSPKFGTSGGISTGSSVAAGAYADAGYSPQRDVIQVTTSDLKQTSTSWDDLSKEMTAAKNEILDILGLAKFAKVNHPRSAYDEAIGEANSSAVAASQNLETTATQLHGSAADYDDTETATTRLANQIGGD